MIASTQNRAIAGKLPALGVFLALVAAFMLLAAGQAHASTTFPVNSTQDNSDAVLTGGVCDTGHDLPKGAIWRQSARSGRR